MIRIAKSCFLWLAIFGVRACAEEYDAAATIRSTADWPGFLGPGRNGKSGEVGLPKEWPATGPEVVWQKLIGVGYAAPAISDGRVFHFARFGDAARLTCLDATTGGEIWTCEHPTDYEDMLGYNNGPRATPVVDGESVYTFSAEGILQCVRVTNGQVLWRVDTTRKWNVVKNFFGVGSTPLVWGNLLLVNVGGSPPGSPADVYAARGNVQTNGACVVAFDKTTGEVKWQTGEDLASYASPVVARVGGREVVFMFARGGLLAIDPVKGETLAKYPWRARLLESVNASTPVVKGNEVFVSETYGPGSALVRLKKLGRADLSGGGQSPFAPRTAQKGTDPGTGTDPCTFEEVWTDRERRRMRAMALHWNTPIEHDGYLYGSSGYHSPEAELRCVEWKTGKVMWSEPDMGRSSLLWVDGVLVCLSEEGALRLIRATPERYEELAEWELLDVDGAPLLKYPAWAAPALARGLLYVQGKDRLVCLRLMRE
jgi:outer membrane protein assembly factor BamB